MPTTPAPPPRAELGGEQDATITEVAKLVGDKWSMLVVRDVFRGVRRFDDLCADLGVAFLPWSPLGGIAKAGELGSAHGAFAEVAAERGVSPQQVCLAWLLARSPVVIPIPGARRVESVLSSVAAAAGAIACTSR